MSDNVILEYCRVGEFYDGEVRTQVARKRFEHATFSDMMQEVHGWLLGNPAFGLSIQRTDRDGLMPVQLPRDALELLRTDPLRYIKLHSVSPRVVDLRSKSNQRVSALVAGERYTMPKATGLRAGCRTLAAAFGETIYLRMRNTFIEHPGTGRWIKYPELERTLGTTKMELLITDDSKGMGWATIPLNDLLATKFDRFYLPRDWNPYGGWITRKQLDELHAQFVEEKGAMLCHLEAKATS